MLGKAARKTVTTRTGRKAAKAGAKVAAKAAKAGAKGTGKAALASGKGQAKLARQALSSKEPASSRFLKYGFFLAVGFVGGALVARAASRDGAGASHTGGTGHHTPDPGSPAGRRGQTWGSGTAGPPPPPHQRPGGPNRTGEERGYSDPAGGPLIGERHGVTAGDVPEQQEEVEQRIRGRVGDDPRTLGMQRLNVEVNDGVAEIRGVAPSETAREAVGEIAASTDGVREVRNLLTVG